MHSYPFQLNLSCFVGHVTQLNPECVPKVLNCKLTAVTRTIESPWSPAASEAAPAAMETVEGAMEAAVPAAPPPPPPAPAPPARAPLAGPYTRSLLSST